MFFHDRRLAGSTLAPLVAALPDLQNAAVLGLPRGGVPVAYEVACASNLDFDVLVVRKMGAPGQPELAIGAVASGGIVVLNDDLVAAFQISEEELRSMIDSEMREIERRELAYREGAPPLNLEGRTVILVDDGLATGATMKAAVRAVRTRAAKVIVAVPVAAPSALHMIEREADRVLCVTAPPDFEAVGQYYRDFTPTSDKEVCTLLAEARRRG